MNNITNLQIVNTKIIPLFNEPIIIKEKLLQRSEIDTKIEENSLFTDNNTNTSNFSNLNKIENNDIYSDKDLDNLDLNNKLVILTNKLKQHNIILNNALLKQNNNAFTTNSNTFDFLLFLKKDEFYNLKLQFNNLISLMKKRFSSYSSEINSGSNLNNTNIIKSNTLTEKLTFIKVGLYNIKYSKFRSNIIIKYSNSNSNSKNKKLKKKNINSKLANSINNLNTLTQLNNTNNNLSNSISKIKLNKNI